MFIASWWFWRQETSIGLQAEAAQQRLGIKESHYLHREAMDALSAILGDFKAPVESLAGNLEDALEIAALKSGSYQIAENPNLAVMESAAEAQRARIRLAKSERIPDVNLDLFYRRLQGTREDAFDVGGASQSRSSTASAGAFAKPKASLGRRKRDWYVVAMN